MMVREIEVHTESMAEQKLGGYSSRYRFTGKELDPLSGLYEFGARYYDPRLSVWFGVDPLAEKAPGWNPFRYGFNNPIRMIDPNGMNEMPPEGFTGDAWCDKDWCFNKIKEDYYQWTDDNCKDMGVYFNKSTEVNPKRSLFSSIGEKMKNIISRVTGDAFESDNGRFNSEESDNANYKGNIDNLLALADAMKSVQGVSNPLGQPENNEQAVKQLGEIADWGADGGNIIYNLPFWDEKSRNRPDTFSWYGDRLKELTPQ